MREVLGAFWVGAHLRGPMPCAPLGDDHGGKAWLGSSQVAWVLPGRNLEAWVPAGKTSGASGQSAWRGDDVQVECAQGAFGHSVDVLGERLQLVNGLEACYPTRDILGDLHWLGNTLVAYGIPVSVWRPWAPHESGQVLPLRSQEACGLPESGLGTQGQPGSDQGGRGLWGSVLAWGMSVSEQALVLLGRSHVHLESIQGTFLTECVQMLEGGLVQEPCVQPQSVEDQEALRQQQSSVEA